MQLKQNLLFKSGNKHKFFQMYIKKKYWCSLARLKVFISLKCLNSGYLHYNYNLQSKT